MVVSIRTKSCLVESTSPPSGDGLCANLSFAIAEFQSNPLDDPLDNAGDTGPFVVSPYITEIAAEFTSNSLIFPNLGGVYWPSFRGDVTELVIVSALTERLSSYDDTFLSSINRGERQTLHIIASAALCDVHSLQFHSFCVGWYIYMQCKRKNANIYIFGVWGLEDEKNRIIMSKF